MVEYPAPKLDESPKKEIGQPEQQSAPNTGNGAARKNKAIVAKDLADIGTLIQGAQFAPAPPPKMPRLCDAVPEGKVKGVVLESAGTDDDHVKWTKVLVKLGNSWTVGIIENPSVLLEIATVVMCRPVMKKNDRNKKILSITEVVVLEETSPVGDLYKFLINADNHKEFKISLVYFSDLAKAMMESLPLRTGIKDFLKEQGIDYLVGELQPNQFIAKTK